MGFYARMRNGQNTKHQRKRGDTGSILVILDMNIIIIIIIIRKDTPSTDVGKYRDV